MPRISPQFAIFSLIAMMLLAQGPAVIANPPAMRDLAPVALIEPTLGTPCYHNEENITVRVKNVGTNPLNFALNPATVTVTVTGPVMQVNSEIISTGTLAPNATLDVMLLSPMALDMTLPGVYTFATTATVAGDQNPMNDNLLPSPTRNVANITTWTGANGPNWFDSGSWTGCVPSPFIDAVIPGGLFTYPTIDASQNAEVHTLTINTGALVALNSDSLIVTGNFVNNGNFQTLGGLVEFRGPAPHQVGGSSVTIFRDLTIGNTDVTLAGPIKIERVLALISSGNLNLAGFPLTLLSDAFSTSMVVNLGTGVVLGNTAHMQRHLLPGPGGMGLGYRHFSAPISDATFASLTTAGYLPKVNGAYNTAPNPLSVSPYPNVFGFDESRYPTSPDFIKGYYSPTALTDPMVVGKGYSLYMPGTSRIEFVGTLTNGDVSQSLTQTGGFLGNGQKSGWHLLGNPYPGPLQWDSISFPAGMSHAASVFSSSGQAGGTYKTRVNGMGPLNGGDDRIGMGQGYFVRVSATVMRPSSPQASGYTTTNTSRTTIYSNPPTRRPRPDSRPRIGLALRATGADSTATDQAWIYFQAGATTDLDLEFDGEKPQHNPGLPTIVSLTAGADELAVNGLPATTLLAGTTIPLLLDFPAAGSYTIEAAALRNLTGTAVVLFDQLTNTRYALDSQPSITFTVGAPGETRTRFVLEVGLHPTGLAAAAAGTALALYPNPARGAVQVRITHLAATVELLDATGRVVRTQATTTGTATLPLVGLPAGIYAVRVGALTQHLIVD